MKRYESDSTYIASLHLTLLEGLGIAYVSALRAKVPVKLYDNSPAQIQKSLSFMDKLLAKDVAKGKLREDEAREAKERVQVGQHGEMDDVDMVIEARNSLVISDVRNLINCVLHRRFRRT